MSLVAWYPLNGGTVDYSGKNFSTYQYNSVVNADGKIGKCFEFNGSSHYMMIENSCKGSKNISICFWMKPNTPGAWSDPFSFHNQVRLEVGGSQNLYYWFVDGCGISSNTLIFDNIVNLEWQHVCIVVDDSGWRSYRNGVLNLSGSRNSTNTPIDDYYYLGKRGYGTSYWRGFINDFRIYNHALTLKEIKEISKGLILHYDFNKFKEPTINMNNNFSFSTLEKGVDYFVKTGTDLWHQGLSLSKTNVVAGKTYTWSFYVKSDISFTPGFDANCTATNYTGNDLAMETDKSYKTSYSKVSEWERMYLTVKIKDDAVSPYLHHSFCPNVTGDTVLKVYVKDSMVEEKSYYTDFVISERTNQKVWDSSGFKNHSDNLTLDSTPRWVSEGVMGSGCYYFDSSGVRYISDGFFNVPNNITVNLWFKTTSIGLDDYHIPFSINGTDCEMSVTSTGQLRIGYKIGGTRYVYNSSSTILKDGNWHMLTSSFDGSTIRGYIDGVLVITQSQVGSLIRGHYTLCLGRLSDLRYGNVDVYMDDVRIYATALNDSDIMELYSVRGNIDKCGNLFVGELNETITYREDVGGINLIRNGFGEYKNIDNMSSMTYVVGDGIDNRCFERVGSLCTSTSDYIEVDPNDIYELSCWIRHVSGTTQGNAYIGLMCYDKDKSFISYNQVNRYETSKTTLARDLINGDTIVYLTSTTGWQRGTDGVEHYTKQIAIFDRQECPNYERSSRNDMYLTLDTTSNTITLKNAWSGGTKVAGTKVANAYDGGTYNYIAFGGKPSTTWSKKRATITGWGTNSEGKFRYGTKYIRCLLFMNSGGSSDSITRICNYSFINRSHKQNIFWKKVSGNLSKKGVFSCDEIMEYNFKPTLIDYSRWVLSSNLLSESVYLLKYNPRGDMDVVLGSTMNDIESNGEGGFDYSGITIDKTKKYRVSCWVRRENVGNGRTYFGCQGSSVCNLNDSVVNTNPYFWSGLIGDCSYLNNNWVLFVAYIHPSDYSNTISDSTNGLYDYGTKSRVKGVKDFKWSSTATVGGFRSYLFYSTSTGERQYWYRPRFEVCDGGEPSIAMLLRCNEHTPLVDRNGKYISKDTMSIYKNGIVSCKEIKEC